VSKAFAKHGYPNAAVVIKQRAFENWLIGDLASLRAKHPKKYQVRDSLIERILSSGADSMNGETVLNGCIADGYAKRKDAVEICKCISPEVVAASSRSFRRFLRVVGDKKYREQSKNAK
jgi:hypothetical protein